MYTMYTICMLFCIYFSLSCISFHILCIHIKVKCILPCITQSLNVYISVYLSHALFLYDQVTRIQFTNKDTYVLINEKGKKIARVTLSDPEPFIPETFLTDNPETQQGDYVMVKCDSIVNLQAHAKEPYIFAQVDKEVLQGGSWDVFYEDLTLDDIVALEEDFLLFYQRIDTTTKACKTPKTARGKKDTTASGAKAPTSRKTTRATKKPRR